MKLNELKPGDKLWCLRVDIYILKIVCIELKVVSIVRDYRLDVRSNFLERYSIYGSLDKEINGKHVYLDCGQPEEVTTYIEEYLFETLDSCKEFAIEYCKNKIKAYEQNIQTIEAW